MIEVFHGFYKRYFSEEEAIIFTLLLAVSAIIVFTMGSIIAPLLWSIILTFLLQGLVNTLCRFNVPRNIAVYIVYLLFLGATLLIILVFLPFTWSRLLLFVNELPSMVNQLTATLLALQENYPEYISEDQVQIWLNNMQGEIGVLGQSIVSYSVASITRLVTWVVYTVLVPIMVFFMLKDSAKLLNWLESWLPEKRPIMAQVWHEMNDQLANYIRGKAVEILIVGGTSYILLTVLNLNYPLLLAVLIGFSVLIPFVGATVVALPVFLVGFFQWGLSGDLYQVLIAYAVLQLIDGNILVPLIFSETVNLHPIAIITAVLVFGGLWGFWGVFFAIPLATFIKAVIRAWPVSHHAPRAITKPVD